MKKTYIQPQINDLRAGTVLPMLYWVSIIDGGAGGEIEEPEAKKKLDEKEEDEEEEEEDFAWPKFKFNLWEE